MKLSEFKREANRKRTKRRGRGPSSGMGKTSSRGHKGQKSRSGYKVRAGTEGGGIPLFRRLPKKGFSNARFKAKTYSINLDRLSEIFEDGEVVNWETLLAKGFPLRRIESIRILGNGDMTKKLVIEANHFSKSAIKKLEEKSVKFKRV